MAFVGVPWTRVERSMLAYCVEKQMDWSRASRCVQHLGNLIGRAPLDCAAEYARMQGAWSQQSRVVPTVGKLVEEQRLQRMEQLEKRIRARQRLVSEMEEKLLDVVHDRDVLRLVDAVMRDVDTARIFARAGGLWAWREAEKEAPLDEDDGWGPFAERPPSKRQRQDDEKGAEEEIRLPEPFEALPLLPPSLHPASPWPLPPALTLSEQTSLILGPEDPSLLLGAFESVSGHRAAQLYFQEPVTDELAPRYSAAVLQPMCMAHIRTRLLDGTITNALELRRDLELMLCNAFVYNAPNSEVYQAAEKLQLVIEKEVEPLSLCSLLQRVLHPPLPGQQED